MSKSVKRIIVFTTIAILLLLIILLIGTMIIENQGTMKLRTLSSTIMGLDENIAVGEQENVVVGPGAEPPEEDGEDIERIIPITKIQISGLQTKVGNLNLINIDGSVELIAEIEPENATNKDIRWSTDNPNVISIDSETGKITAKKEGIATVLAASVEYSNVAIYKVLVVKVPEIITIEGQDFIKVDQTATLTATVLPVEAKDTTSVIWESSNENILKVNKETGEILGIAEGTATVTAKSVLMVNGKDVIGIQEEKEITVVTKGIEGEQTIKLGEEAILDIQTSKEIKWMSDDASIISIDALTGKIKANKLGKVNIIALAKETNEILGILEIEVLPIITKSISINGIEEIKVGDKKTFEVTIAPENVTNKSVKWYSSNEKILNINRETGEFEAVSKGLVNIIAIAQDESKCITVRTFSVTETEVATESIKIEKIEDIHVGEEKELVFSVLPSNSTDLDVGIVSSDETVAKIIGKEEKVYVKALKEGEVKISILLISNKEIKTDLELKVLAEIQGSKIEISEIEDVRVGQIRELTATVAPENSLNKNIKWTTSDETILLIEDETVGKFKALKEGKATITVTLVNNDKVTASYEIEVKEEITATGIKIEKPEKVNLYDDLMLKVNITPEDVTNKEVEWASSNTSVIKINKVTGEIKALSVGKATIVARLKANNELIDIIEIEVKEPIEVTNIVINDKSEMLIGDKTILNATTEPENINVAWYSDNEEVISINKFTGEIMAEGVGKAKIKAISYNGEVSDEIEIEVLPILVEDITITGKSELSMGINEKLVATVMPENATNKEVEWKCLNEDIVKINSQTGEMQPISIGRTTIIVSAKDGNIFKAYNIEVIRLVESIEIVAPKILEGGETAQAQAIILPEDATNKIVSWISNDEKIIKIDSETGMITAVGPGTASIAAASIDGAILSTFEIKVTQHVKEIVIEVLETMKVGEKINAKATVLPETAENCEVTWKTANTDIIAINSEIGSIEAKKAGVAYIIATAKDGSGVVASKKIIVTKVEEEPEEKPGDEEKKITTEFGLDDVKKIISKIPRNITLSEIIEKITTEETIKFFNGTEEIKDMTLKAKTGMKMKIGEEIYEISIIGDVNKDGNATIVDALKICKHILEKELLTGAQFESADINSDGIINLLDMTKLIKLILK